MINQSQDKTYIFRKFFGFDVFSMCHQLSKIMHTPNLDLYIYADNDIYILGQHTIAWMTFWEDWVASDEEIVPLFTRFISDPFEALKDIYMTANSILQLRLEECIKFNRKEDVYEAFTSGLINKARTKL